jgi:hypothetical protein
VGSNPTVRNKAYRREVLELSHQRRKNEGTRGEIFVCENVTI